MVDGNRILAEPTQELVDRLPTEVGSLLAKREKRFDLANNLRGRRSVGLGGSNEWVGHGGRAAVSERLALETVY